MLVSGIWISSFREITEPSLISVYDVCMQQSICHLRLEKGVTGRGGGGRRGEQGSGPTIQVCTVRGAGDFHAMIKNARGSLIFTNHSTADSELRDSLLVACLTSQQLASVSQGRICSDNLTCCQTQIEVADQTFYLTQSQYIDTRPTSPSADPIMPGAWRGSYCSAVFKSLV